nr:MAG TPA: hypothetical protein [Caudoviricetes sp.]
MAWLATPGGSAIRGIRHRRLYGGGKACVSSWLSAAKATTTEYIGHGWCANG